MDEALEVLAGAGHPRSTRMRLRAFPFPHSVRRVHRRSTTSVFVVEQNRDAQMRSLLVNELEIDPARLVPVLHYDGTPITARFITAGDHRPCHALAIARAAPRRGTCA